MKTTGYSGIMAFTRITIDPAVCTGKPCIRGLRFPVARLLGLLAAGETPDAILKAYPYLDPGDIERHCATRPFSRRMRRSSCCPRFLPSEVSDITQSIIVVERDRVRRRRLPIGR